MNKRALKVMLLCIVMVSLITFGCKKDNPEPTIDELKNLTTLPVLTYPTNNATGVPTSFTFTWDASKWSDKKNHGAFSYEILYGIDNPPTTKVSLAEGVTQYFVNGLELNKKYYVKVIALKDGIEFKESVVYNFTTETGLFPTAPTLNFPANLATECSIKPRLAWSTSTDPEGKGISYDVYLDTSTNPTTKILVNQSITSIIIPTFLEGETQYFWKVVAKDADGNETASQIRNFSTKANAWIPDINFRTYLKTNFSNAFHGDTLHYLHSSVVDFNGIIDVHSANISSLKGIEYFKKITKLICSGNKLISLNVSKNTELLYLDCNGNDISSIDLLKNEALSYLNINGNELTSLDLSKNSLITSLTCNYNKIETLSVSKNIDLKYLECVVNELTSLDLSQNINLRSLRCYNNKLTSILTNPSLLTLECSNNQLESLNLSNNSNLIYLYCSNNKLSTLDLSKNALLERLGCQYNYLSNIDISSQINWNDLWIRAGEGYHDGYFEGSAKNLLTIIKVNDAVKNHQQIKDAKTKLPNITIEVYSEGVKICSNYDPNANGGAGTCITP